MVDTLALKRGTWVIVVGTKLGINLWDGLDIEYASLLVSKIALADIRDQGSLLLLLH